MILLHLVVAGLYALLGWGLCVRWRLPCRGLEGFAWAYGVGTGVASLGIMALVAIGAWMPFAQTPALALLVLGLAVILAGWSSRLPFASPSPTPRHAVRSRAAAYIVAGFGVLLFFLRASNIDTGFDAQAYHLPAVAHIARSGLGATVGLLDGEFRLGFDLLFLPGFDLASPTSADPAIVHLVAALALAAGIAAEIARRTSFVVGIGFGGLFLVTPGVASIANHAYVDVGVGLYVFLALAAASRALREGDRTSVLAAGLFAGFAANAKLPAGAAIAAVAVMLLAGHRGARGTRNATIATATAVLIALPWFVRAYLNTGNPFFPSLLGPFGSGWADASVVAATKQGVLDQLPIPQDAIYGVRAIVHGAFSAAGGFEAPAWVVALAPAALLRPGTPDRRGLLAGGAILLVSWVAFVPLFRFGIGLWAWGAVAAAFGWSRLYRAARPVALGLLAVLVALLGVGLFRAARPTATTNSSAEVAARFGAAVEFLINPTRTVHGPIGLSSSFVGFGPPGTISLEPARNGLLRAEDFDDPERLLDALRRIGIRSLVLDETTSEGRKAIVCAQVWAHDRAAPFNFHYFASRRGTLMTVTLPWKDPK